MNRLKFGVLLVLLVFGNLENRVASAGAIVYPWRATASIVEAGMQFNILFHNDMALPVDSVCLVSSYYSEKLTIDTVETGRFEYDHYTRRSVNNQLWVRVSSRAPEELYDLFLYCGEEVHRSPKSVKVVRAFRSSHRFIHISDLHMTRQWVGTPEEGYAKELELFDRFVEVANLLAPDFILVTGDQIMEYSMVNADSTGWGGERIYEADKHPLLEEKYKNLFWGSHGFQGVYGLNAPTFFVPGNHDFHGIDINDYLAKCHQWNDKMGKRIHGFSYAGTRIILADDSLGDPQEETPAEAPMSGRQGREHEAFLQRSGMGNVRIMAQHKHSAIDTAFLNRNRINVLVNGHSHSPSNEVIGTTPTHHTRPGVICRSGEIKTWEKNLGFFRIFYINGDSVQYSEPLRFCANPTAAYEDIELNLTVDYDHPNDGTQNFNRVTVKNSLPVHLADCRVRLVLKKGEYEVDGGLVSQVIQTDDKSVLDLVFDIRCDEEKIISVTAK